MTEFIDIIANHIENKLLTSLRNATMYTLLADESTDEQNREQLSIYARWTTVSAKPVDHFLGIVHVTKTNAESLLNAIQGFLVAKGLDITKCRFVGFDGANVMSGEVSGEFYGLRITQFYTQSQSSLSLSFNMYKHYRVRNALRSLEKDCHLN